MARRKNEKDTALLHAIDVAGGPGVVAEKFGISKQAVSLWKRCPVRRAIDLEQLTNGVVTRQRLRPDIYPA